VHLTGKQGTGLADRVQYNSESIRRYLLKEEYWLRWPEISPYWAGRVVESWCMKTMRSKIQPMKKVARMLRCHRPLSSKWFFGKGGISSAVVEGFNNKARRTTRETYGLRTSHGLGDLPESTFAHSFRGWGWMIKC
jgi:transposase